MSETGEIERTDETIEGEEAGESGSELLTYREWANALREDTLLGQKCSDCGHVTAAPKAACAQCGSREIATTELDTEGEVYTVTTVAVPPERFEGEYQVAVVNLGAGRVLARIDGEVEIGDRVGLAGAMETEGHPAPVFEAREAE